MRKTFLALSLVVALTSGAFAQTSSESTNVLMADHKVMELGDKYLALLTNLYPEEATRLGTGIYHDQLLPRDKQSQITRNKSILALQNTLREMNPKKLSPAKKAQYYVLLGQVNKKVFDEEVLNQTTKDPLWYLESLNSVYDIVEKNYATKEERLRDAIKRLEVLPQILEQGQENIENAPDLRMRLAMQKTQVAYSSFDDFSATLTKMASTDQSREKISTVSKDAKEALKKYFDFLKAKLETKEYVDFRLGEDDYSRLLDEVYFLHDSTAKYTKEIETEKQKAKDELIVLLAQYLAEILNEEERAKRTDEEGNIVTIPFDYYLVRNTLFNKAPKVEDIADTYAATYQSTSDFFTQKELFDAPVLALALKNNPKYLRQAYEPSQYLAPYPFSARQSNDLLLNIPWDKEETDSDLFTYSDIKIDVLQKLLPGMGLSYNATSEEQQVLLKISNDMFYLHGWAQYALKLAQEQGYFESDEDLLNILWLRYKRAVYALADIKMQTKELNYTQTLDMLISAGINDEEAVAAVDFLAIHPAYAFSYVVGAQEFERLNLKYQKKLKEKYNAKEFYNKILSLGRIPLNVLEENLENSYKEKPIESFFNMTYF